MTKQWEKSLLAYINATPDLVSLLSDCDLLPEQVKPQTFDRERMLLIAEHWQARENAWYRAA